MLVKIKRDSIKKNPEAGKTRTYVKGHTDVFFWVKGNHKYFLDDKKGVFVSAWNNDFTEGLLLSEDFADIIKNIGAEYTIKVNNNGQFLEHRPLPEWLYEYEDVKIKCSHCKSLVSVKDINKDYIGYDEIEVIVCPVCNHYNTFEPIEYENINNVMM